MILCVLDDLIFSIKISTAAKRLGAELFFERTPGMVIDRVREQRPALVIFDLNCTKLDPLGAIAAMKADPALLATPTLGFVAHVDAGTIAAARAAGIDQVLARSAFVAQLGRILTGPPPARE